MSSALEEASGDTISRRSNETTSSSFDAGVSERSSLELSIRLEESTSDGGTSRYFILAIALLCSVWSAGLIFGWAPLYSTLLHAGVYADRCPTPTPSNSTLLSPDYALNDTILVPSAIETSDGPLCDAQQTRLNLIYTAGSAFTQASLFVSGVFLDFQGPKLTASISALVVALGSLLFGAASLFNIDFYIVGFALMGFGGAGVNLATYTVSNLFPRYKSWVVSSLVGVWTLSSLWFLLFRPAFNAGIPLHSIFFAQSALLFLTAIVFFFTFPSRALREGERFSFHQWLPWNAWSHKEHYSVQALDHEKSENGDIALETYNEAGYEHRKKRSSNDSNSTEQSTRGSQEGSIDIPSASSSQELIELDLDAIASAGGAISSLKVSSRKVHSSDPSGGKSDAISYSLDLETREAAPAPVRSGVDPAAHSTLKAILADMMTMDFILLTIWFAVSVLFFEFSIGTIADALDYRTRQSSYPLGPADISASHELSQKTDHYVLAFNLAYAVGFVFVPLYAWTTDRLGFTGSFFIATLLAVLYPLLAVMPSLWFSQASFYFVYSAAIQFVYSCQFGFVSHRFGYNHFGVLVGVMGLVAASLIPLQPVFLKMVISKFGGNFFWMYIIQGAVTLPLFGIVVWNWISSKRALILGNNAA